MVKQQKIIWTNHAQDEFEGILEFYFIRNGSLIYSEKIFKKVNTLLNHLRENPYLGKSIDFKQIRSLPIENFVIYYRILQLQIEIVSFWAPSTR